MPLLFKIILYSENTDSEDIGMVRYGLEEYVDKFFGVLCTPILILGVYP